LLPLPLLLGPWAGLAALAGFAALAAGTTWLYSAEEKQQLHRFIFRTVVFNRPPTGARANPWRPG
jgi:hypothetical protein